MSGRSFFEAPLGRFFLGHSWAGFGSASMIRSEEGNFVEIRSILRNQVYRMARAFVDSSVPSCRFAGHD
jgi:hypothetical protein